MRYTILSFEEELSANAFDTLIDKNYLRTWLFLQPESQPLPERKSPRRRLCSPIENYGTPQQCRATMCSVSVY